MYPREHKHSKSRSKEVETHLFLQRVGPFDNWKIVEYLTSWNYLDLKVAANFDVSFIRIYLYPKGQDLSLKDLRMFRASVCWNYEYKNYAHLVNDSFIEVIG